MLKIFKNEASSFKEISQDQFKAQLADVIWVDLYNPTSKEEKLIENILGINIPTHDEMREIELSSRLYERNKTLFMTLTMVTHADTPHPESHAVTFVLHGKHLITIRYVDTPHLSIHPLNARSNAEMYQQGSSLLVWMLDKIADQLADILENIAREIGLTSQQIFESQNGSPSNTLNFKNVISSIGAHENLLSRSQESLFSATRLLSFISETSLFEGTADQKAIHLMMRDLPPLIEHASFLSNKITFLLDATLGMINIEQNTIIKIVSVAAVVFFPPTLVASIYGMNFKSMPELSWDFGYPVAILLMLLAGFLPYRYFKYKKWL